MVLKQHLKVHSHSLGETPCQKNETAVEKQKKIQS
jgi:hypothetical protein